MKQDRFKWNKKYREDFHPAEVAGVVKRFYHLAPGKKALDIASGTGRHTIFLARNGFSVDAVDISEVGLAEFAGKYPNIHAICADLDQFEIPADRYDLIVNVKFLNRRLFPYIQEGLKPGGVVIFDTLLEPDDIKSTPKHHRDYLLRTNELLHAFLGMRIVYYRETVDPETGGSDRTASLVGVKI
jgi:SAM-dependent methyltransferase